MRILFAGLLFIAPTTGHAQTLTADLPPAPLPSLAQAASPALPGQTQPLVDSTTAYTSIGRTDAERLALKNNPRISANRLLALAAGQVTRETRSGLLPQILGAATAEKAEDGSRISANGLTDSRLYTHAGAGGSFSQLVTDFGHTRELIAMNKLQQRAQDQTALATEQDVLLAADQAFYRLLNAQSLLDVAKATVAARGDVQNLTSALTRSALKSDLDLNVAAADLSQSQLLQLDAENSVASASAALVAILATPIDTVYRAVEDPEAAVPPPPRSDSSAALNATAQAQRPDLLALRLTAAADQKLVSAQQRQYLPAISAMATGGVTPSCTGRNLRSSLLRGWRSQPGAPLVYRLPYRCPDTRGPVAPAGRRKTSAGPFQQHLPRRSRCPAQRADRIPAHWRCGSISKANRAGAQPCPNQIQAGSQFHR